MPNQRSPRLLRASLACLFAALCCAGAYISIPIPGSPVPVVIQNLFAVLAGLLLGPAWGGLSVILFIFVGCLGFPVFSGGKAGIAVLAGPTGGYLAGYLVAAALAGLIARRRGKALPILGTVVAFTAILAVGVVRLKLLKNVDWGKALSIGVVPFLPGDAIKASLTAILAIRLGPFVDSLLAAPKANDAA